MNFYLCFVYFCVLFVIIVSFIVIGYGACSRLVLFLLLATSFISYFFSLFSLFLHLFTFFVSEHIHFFCV